MTNIYKIQKIKKHKQYKKIWKLQRIKLLKKNAFHCTHIRCLKAIIMHEYVNFHRKERNFKVFACCLRLNEKLTSISDMLYKIFCITIFSYFIVKFSMVRVMCNLFTSLSYPFLYCCCFFFNYVVCMKCSCCYMYKNLCWIQIDKKFKNNIWMCSFTYIGERKLDFKGNDLRNCVRNVGNA